MTPDKEKTFNNNTHLQFWEKGHKTKLTIDGVEKKIPTVSVIPKLDNTFMIASRSARKVMGDKLIEKIDLDKTTQWQDVTELTDFIADVKRESEAVWTKTSEQGTAIHSFYEQVLKSILDGANGMPSYPTGESEEVKMYRRIFYQLYDYSVKKIKQVFNVEELIYSNNLINTITGKPMHYSGIYDNVVMHSEYGKVLGDLKTGTKKSNTSSFPITTAGYMNAYCQNNNCEPFDRLITFVDRESNPVEIKEFYYPVSTYKTHLKIFQNYLEIYSFLNEKKK